MSSSKSEPDAWTRAIKTLAKDPNAKIECPRCKEGTIEVSDVEWSADPSRFDRYLKCSACGATNVAGMSIGSS